MIIVVWVSLGLLAYHYLVYPAAVLLAAKLIPSNQSTENIPDESVPSVSLVIAAYNEESVICGKLENSLALDYPQGMLEVIVVSDGSSDSTPVLVQKYAHRGVVSMHEPTRRGKTAALNRGVRSAKGDIVVFSDANNYFNPGAVRALVRHFSDLTVGGVCGVKRIRVERGRESSEGDSMYWRYESAIKLAESSLGTITNGDGEIFAVRRALYRQMDESVINDDAELTIILVKNGYRVLYEPKAESYELSSIQIRDDFFVKVRMVAGGYQTICRHAWFLLPPRNWFTFAFLSHKILRWSAPLWMLALLVSSAMLVGESLYAILLVFQLGFYALGVVGWSMREQYECPKVVYVPFYFCAMNLAALFGLVRFLRRTQKVQWQKARR